MTYYIIIDMAEKERRHGMSGVGSTPYERPESEKEKKKKQKAKANATRQAKEEASKNEPGPSAQNPMDSSGTTAGGAGGSGNSEGPGGSGSGGIGGGTVPPPTYDPSSDEGDQKMYGIVKGSLGDTLNYRSQLGSQRAYLNSKVALKRALTGLSATYIDDRTRTLFPNYEASMKPTKTDKPFEGNILELLQVIGLKDGSRSVVDLEYGFAKLTTKPKPGVIEFTGSIAGLARFTRQDDDMSTLKDTAGKKAMIPGAGGVDVVCSNLQYSWTPLVVAYRAYESRRTHRRRFGRIGGKPNRGHFLLTQGWLNSQKGAMFGKEDGGDVTVLDLAVYLETAYNSVIAHGGACEFVLKSHGDPKFYSDTMRLRLTRKVIAATKKIKKRDGNAYNEMINSPVVKAYYKGKSSAGAFPPKLGVVTE